MTTPITTPLPPAVITAYRDAFKSIATSVDAADLAARQQALDAFMANGFPSKRQEQWRYTDLSELNSAVFSAANDGPRDEHAEGEATAEKIESALRRLPKTDGLVYLDGALIESLSSAPELSGSVNFTLPPLHGTDTSGLTAHHSQLHAPLAATAEQSAAQSVDALNQALASDGLNLTLGSNSTIARAFHLVLASSNRDQATMCHQRHRIELGTSSHATLIIDFRSAPSDATAINLMTQSFEIILGENAQLTIYRVQDISSHTQLVTRINAKIASNAQLSAVCIDSGSGACRHDFDIELAGTNAEIDLSGLYQPRAPKTAPESSRTHLDNHTLIVHAQPHGRSREVFRGIVEERVKAIFNGKILVARDAQKTDSEQRVATLLLSRRAEANAKPELEIHADDVRCAHGSTVGQLDQTALAYLRSRGIDADTAKKLLLNAFAAQILDRIQLPALRELLNHRLGLPQGLAGDTADQN